ncbi:RHS repeat-associated core domain-containing protein, partial [Aliagarivorans taiwanensis]
MRSKFVTTIMLCSIFATASLAWADDTLPTHTGVLPSEFNVVDGTANYRIPIEVPQGKANLQPEFSLVYHHTSGAGLTGYGWTFSGSSMFHRCEKTEAVDGINQPPQYQTDDAYCLDGQRLILVEGSPGQAGAKYRAEVNPVDYITIREANDFGPTTVEIRNVEGLLHIYNTPVYGPSAEEEPDSHDPVRQLMLTTTEGLYLDAGDIPNPAAHPNMIAYEYCEYPRDQDDDCRAKEDEQFVRLKAVWYGGNINTTTGAGRIDFTWVESENQTQGWVHGRPQNHHYRLSALSVKGSSLFEAWRYELYYTADEFGVDYLTQVRMCSPGSSDCLPPIDFKYQWQLESSGVEFEEDTRFQQVGYESNYMADITGNGAQDLIGVDSDGLIYVAQGSRNAEGLLEWAEYKQLFSDSGGIISDHSRLVSMDLYQDGTNDLVFLKDRTLEVSIVEGTYVQEAFASASTPAIEEITYAVGCYDDHPAHALYLADVTGNGYADLICESAWTKEGGVGSRHDFHFRQQYRELSDGVFQESVWIVNYTEKHNGRNQEMSVITHLGDFNNDGVAGNYSGKELYAGSSGPIGSSVNSIHRLDMSLNASQRFGRWGAPLQTFEGGFLDWMEDINGDSNLDFLRLANKNTIRVVQGLGTGYFSTMEDLTTTHQDIESSDNVGFFDISGNGQLDLYYWLDGALYVRYQVAGLFLDAEQIISDVPEIKEQDFASFVDVLGDGRVSFIVLDEDKEPRIFHGNRSLSHKFLARVDSLDSASIKFSYQAIGGGSTHYDPDFLYYENDEQRDYLLANTVSINRGMFLVDEVIQLSPKTEQLVGHKTYRYGGFRDGLKGRGFLGLGYVAMRDELANHEVRETRSLIFPFNGQVAEVEDVLVPTTGAEVLLNHSQSAYCMVSPQGKMVPGVATCETTLVNAQRALNPEQIWFSHLQTNVQQAFELDGTQLTDTYTHYSDFDEFMNVGRIESQVDSLVSLIPGDYYRTETVSTFKPPAMDMPWQNNRVESTTVKHITPEGDYSDTASFTYYQNGLLESETNGDSNTYLTTIYEYDALGNVTKETMQASGADIDRVVTYEYDKGLFLREQKVSNLAYKPDGSEELSNQTTAYTYDATTGFVKTEKPPGFIDATITYYRDWLGRVEAIDYPGIATDTTYTRMRVTDSTRSNCEASGLPDAAYCEIERAPGDITTIKVISDIGHTLREVSYSMDGKAIYVDIEYDHRGQPVRISRPYFSGYAPYWSVQTYDAIGRPLTISEPSGDGGTTNMTRTAYFPGYTATFDKNGVQSRRYENARGDVIRQTSEGKATIDYVYHPKGWLVQTTLDGEHPTFFEYDRLGHKTVHDDPAMGRWTFDNNGFGEVIVQTDPEGVVTTTKYDQIGQAYQQNRILDTREERAYWVYASDGAPNLAEQHIEVLIDGELQAEQSVVQMYEYRWTVDEDTHGMGQLTKQTQALHDPALGDIQWVIDYDYNSEGQLDTESRPNGFDIIYHYQHGHLSALTGPVGQNTMDISREEVQDIIDEAIANAEIYLAAAEEIKPQLKQLEAWELEMREAAGQTIPVEGVNDTTLGRYQGRAHRVWYSDEGYAMTVTPDTFVPLHGTVTIPLLITPDFHYIFDPNTAEVIEISHDEYLEIAQGGDTPWGVFTESTDNAWFGELSAEGLVEIVILDGNTFSTNPYVQNDWRGTLNSMANDYSVARELLVGRYDTYVQAIEDMLSLVAHVGALYGYFDMKRLDEVDRESVWGYVLENLDAPEYSVYWRAHEVDAHGRVRAESFGNGVTTDYNYHNGTGQLHNIDTRGPGDTELFSGRSWLRQMAYIYDRNDNMLSRTDLTRGIQETFSYDSAEQLISAEYNSTNYAVLGKTNRFTETFSYDTRGNFLTKNGVSYQYGNRAFGPTQVGTDTLSYNQRGAVTAIGERQFTWGLAGQALTLSKGTEHVSFVYDADNQRVRKRAGGDDQTFYLGKVYEERYHEGLEGYQAEQRNYLYVGGRAIGVSIKTERVSDNSELSREVHYFHQDALNSVNLITNTLGQVISETWFDPWGEARAIDWEQTSPLPAGLLFGSLTNRGFTGHEHVAEVGLIHMNARIYDPNLGIFLSPDPAMQSPDDALNHNRYAYVVNNPLKYHDPSGNIFGLIISIVSAVIAAKVPLGAIGSMALGFGMGFIGGLVMGMDIQSAFFAGLTSGVFAGVGHALGDTGILHETFGKSPFGRSFVHGMAGGSLNVVKGDNFGTGFL